MLGKSSRRRRCKTVVMRVSAPGAWANQLHRPKPRRGRGGRRLNSILIGGLACGWVTQNRRVELNRTLTLYEFPLKPCIALTSTCCRRWGRWALRKNFSKSSSPRAGYCSHALTKCGNRRNWTSEVADDCEVGVDCRSGCGLKKDLGMMRA